MKKLAIFDLDGTLLNTIEDLGYAANHALQAHGYPTHSIASYPFFVGNGVRRLIERVLPEDARTEATIDRLLVTFKEYYNDHNTDYTKPYEGIPELLSLLSSRGVAIAVASNKYQAATEKLISHFFPTLSFIAVEGQKEGVPVKPDPSIVFEILAKAKTPKADTIYIGDSGVDMETARRACVDSVGVTWGFRPEKELVENHADTIVNSPGDIEKLVFSND
ncbi:MAG: HAD family hydrolase [Muribaculaceae bacterium]|nr:HAD family hydrolase [Muribaculaceae bacterium]